MMYRLTAMSAALAISLASLPAFAQGMNNSYPFDSTDVKNSFSMLGLEAFKFPVRLASDSTPVLNYIVEEYEDGKLVSTMSELKTWKGLPKEIAKMLAEEAQLGENDRFVRVYWHTRAPGDVALRLGYEHTLKDYTFTIDTAKFGLHQCRAMDWSESNITEKKPVSVYYSAYKDKELISCPGSLPVDKIVLRYGHVIVVYIEPVKVPE